MTDTAALSLEHRLELTSDSAISDEVVAARGYRTLTGTGPDRDFLEGLGYGRYVVHRDDAYPGLLVPMTNASGDVTGHQYKPAVPRSRAKPDGRMDPVKYESPKGQPAMVDVPAFTRARLGDPSVALWITEGVKKVDSLVTQGIAAVGLTGVFSWRNSMGTLGDWEDIPLKGQTVVICFDSDAAGNRNVHLAMRRLGAWLVSRKAAAVHYLIVPPEVNGTPVKGVDDYFAAGGTLADLGKHATTTAPGSSEKDASFTDAFLVEELAEELEGRFCWASGLGWLRWTGKVWKEVSDVEPLEAVRVWASGQFDKVLAEQRSEPSKNLQPKITGWRAVLAKSRLTALRDLARGLIQKDPSEFDGDPDLLTVANGTVHLPTAVLRPFDPADCITKSADAEYRPGARHASWEAALEAVPAELQEWYQDRTGQALTGYPVPDHTMVIAYGGGSNGKSTLVSTIRRTLGDYGVMISDRVLMASPDAHPTELMDLRGARYAVMEETPEARHLNVQRVKTVLGTESIKARRIRQDPVEFLASHSLFINTNYRPVVTETDWGTWRRLALMPYPFTFRKPGQPLTGPLDRPGDPALAYISNVPEVRAAALAWMVAGAKAWYERGRMMLPAPELVERETREWRAETDLILGFADDCLRFSPEAFTQTQEMLAAFNEWASERGHRPWNDRTFASRFGGHDIATAAKVKQGRFSVNGKQQRGWGGVEISEGGKDVFGEELPEPPADESREELPEARGEMPEELGTVGFDLETAGRETLYMGGQEGTFVRLCGLVEDSQPEGVTGPSADALLSSLNSSEQIYGVNIFGFDLPALARHHGADYDKLAAKSWDLMVVERLLNPPGARHATKAGFYGLDEMASRYGVAGKTDDIKALAKKHGGFDRIPLGDPDYNAYLRGDLAATRAVKEAQDAVLEARSELRPYADREMRVVALQNRMTLNGWAVDRQLLAERVAFEKGQQDAAVEVLHERYGMPVAQPDRFRLRRKADWPGALQSMPVTEARAKLQEDPEKAVSVGLAERIPGEPMKAPWATDLGREALIQAFADAGAPHYPKTPDGKLALSGDALGEEMWYCPKRRRNIRGMLHPKAYGANQAVRDLVDLIRMATGARAKYAEIAKFVTPAGRVHAWIGAAQGSGRWAMTEPSITNMGIRGAAGEERGVLIADEGHVLLTCDASQVDMRAMAGLSQDPTYMALFEPGRDAHMEMAQVYFGEQTKEARQRTKAINHKLNYGGGAKSTADMNGIPLEVVQQAIAERARAYPVLVEYIESVRERAAVGMLLDNGFGRPMQADPERAYTQGPALVGQGAARDIVCESLLRLVDANPGVTPYLRAVVHDEVVLSVPEDEVEYWKEALHDAFTWEWKGVPILCEVGTPAKRWSDCK